MLVTLQGCVPLLSWSHLRLVPTGTVWPWEISSIAKRCINGCMDGCCLFYSVLLSTCISHDTSVRPHSVWYRASTRCLKAKVCTEMRKRQSDSKSSDVFPDCWAAVLTMPHCNIELCKLADRFDFTDHKVLTVSDGDPSLWDLCHSSDVPNHWWLLQIRSSYFYAMKHTTCITNTMKE